MPKAPADTQAAASFEAEIARSLKALRDAYAALLDALDEPVRTGADLQRATRLDMKLCWKVVRVINASEPLAAAPFILGSANTADFLRVMARKGAPGKLIERVQRTDQRLSALISEHAGDRRTFESMVSGWAGGVSAGGGNGAGGEGSGAAGSAIALRRRRAAFASNSDVWGVTADVVACCGIIQPSQTDPTRLDILALNAELGMRRLRRTALPLYFKRTLVKSDASGPGHDGAAGQTRASLGAGGAQTDQIGLITEFSSVPVSELVVRKDAHGASTITLSHDRLGSKASIDLCIGYRESGVRPPTSSPDDPGWIVHGTQIRKPCRVAIIDLLVRRGLYDRAIPRAAMAPTHAMFPRTRREFEAFGNIDEAAAPARLIGDSEVLARREAGRYGELVDWSLNQSGWRLSDFVVHRYVAKYPVPMSTLAVYFDIPHD